MFTTLTPQASRCAAAAAAFLIAAVIIPSSSAAAKRECTPVNGHFVTRPTDFDGDPNTLDFGGPVNGSIQGRFEARDLQLIEGSPATPDLFLFVEQLDLIGERGSFQGITLKTVGEGSFDTVTGLFTEILTILESVGEEGISGQIFFSGDFDPEAGVGDGDYRGEVCLGNK